MTQNVFWILMIKYLLYHKIQYFERLRGGGCPSLTIMLFYSFQQRAMDNCLWYKLWVKLEIQLFSLFLLISSGTTDIFIALLLFLFALVITFISGFVLKLIRLFLVAYIHWETVEKYNLCDRLLWHIWEHFLKTTPECWKYSNSCG